MRLLARYPIVSITLRVMSLLARSMRDTLKSENRLLRQSLAVILITLSCSSVALAEVQWQTDLEAAKRTAAQTNKLVLLHFWATWCQPCMRMESTVFNQPGVGDTLSKQFVPVKVNIDQRPTTARQYGVTSIPADVIITPDGQMIERANSPRTATGYVGHMQQVAMKVPNRGLQAYANLNTANPNPTAKATALPAADRSTVPYTSAPTGEYGQFPAQDSTAPFTQPAAGQNTLSVPTGNYGENSVAQNPPTGRTLNQPNTSAPAMQPRGDAMQPRGDNFASSDPNFHLPSGPEAFGLPSAGQPPANDLPSVSAPGFQQPNPPVTAQAPLAGDLAPSNSQPHTPPNIADSMPSRNSAQPQSQSQPQPNNAADPLWGMDGFCPVTLVESKQWVAGDRRWGVRHQGRVYLFTSEEAKQKFLANPDYYAPVFAGHDPILLIQQRQAVAGHREHGVFYRDRIYLFSSEATLEQFSANPARYAAQVASLEAQASAGR